MQVIIELLKLIIEGLERNNANFIRFMEQTPVKDPVVEERLLTTKEVISYAHKSASTIEKWKSTGILVPVLIGKMNYYRKSDVIRIMTEGTG